MRHELCATYKSVINKESARKRQREAAAEEARRNEEQQRFQQQYQAALSVATQLLGVDHPVLLQLKNSQLINSLSANPNTNNRLMQLISLLASSANILPNNRSVVDTTSISTPTSVEVTASSSPAVSNVISQQARHCLTSLQQQQLATAATEATLQQQLPVTAALNFLRQRYTSILSQANPLLSIDSASLRVFFYKKFKFLIHNFVIVIKL